uniref:Uncharacterized protein n=1 Tax=Glossina pallidipes TaxID=7398 RepID=A0A1B0AJD5_GLOPL
MEHKIVLHNRGIPVRSVRVKLTDCLDGALSTLLWLETEVLKNALKNNLYNLTTCSISACKSQLSFAVSISLVVDVMDEADGGGVMGRAGCLVKIGGALLGIVSLSLTLADVEGKSSELRSKVTRLTAPTRSLAMRDHDSRRLCASQHAAGPRPLIICINILLITDLSLSTLEDDTPISRQNQQQQQQQQPERTQQLEVLKIILVCTSHKDSSLSITRIRIDLIIKSFLRVEITSWEYVCNFSYFSTGPYLRILPKE